MDKYRRPPGGKQRPLLKVDAIPTNFPTYPALLQPTSSKGRRLIVRKILPPVTTEEAHASTTQTDATVCETSMDRPITPKRSGRPKLPPEQRINKLKQTVNALRKKVRRHQNKTRIQKNLLNILQKENKLQSAQLESIDGCLSELIKNQAINRQRKRNKNFSQKIKEFAFTMHFYSPRSYAYLRSIFDLPTSRTIRRWLESVECDPGFLVDTIQLVAKNCQNSANAFSLVIDSMAIRKRLIIDQSTNKVLGHVTVGDTSKLAGEALVFLLVPILGGIRHPIGYFL
jgi:hypothetical protein